MGPAQIGVLGSKGAAPAWTPLSLSPLIWYNSDATINASTSAWADTMANYNMTAAGPTKPTYTSNALNGRPGLIFDGTNDVLTSTRVTQIQNAANVTIWMVGKRSTISQDDAGATNVTTLFHYTDDNIYTVLAGFKYGFPNAATTNAFHYTLVLYDGTQSTDATKLRMYVDGALKTLTFSGPIPTVTENNASSTLHMGIFYSSTYLAGTACEFGIINRTLTAGEITSLNTYLAATYAL